MRLCLPGTRALTCLPTENGFPIMGTATTSTGDRLTLWRALRVATGPDPTPRATRRVVRHCHQIARATLRQQQRTGSLREDVLGEDAGDLAMDAIAELFERGDQGRFSELREYFGGQLAAGRSEQEVEEQEVEEQEVEEKLRRLVQSAVTDWLFEAYQAADRSLSNQIRALKRAVGRREDACLRRRGTVQWVELATGETLTGETLTGETSTGETADENASRAEDPPKDPSRLGRRRPGRPMPLQVLEAHLTGAVAEAGSTGDLLEKALSALREHPVYEAAYPLTRLAQAMRSARVRVQAVTEHSGTSVSPEEPLLRPGETQRYIDETLRALQAEKRETYVGQSKLTEETYVAYFRALRDRLEARFVPPGDPEVTHYEALSGPLPLGKNEYREEHRSMFEYLERQAREKLVGRLEEVL